MLHVSIKYNGCSVLVLWSSNLDTTQQNLVYFLMHHPVFIAYSVAFKMTFSISNTRPSLSLNPYPTLPSSEPQLWPVGMVLEGSSEALCPPPSLELRPSCNKSQPSPPLGSSSQPHDGVFPEDKEPVKYGELIVLG